MDREFLLNGGCETKKTDDALEHVSKTPAGAPPAKQTKKRLSTADFQQLAKELLLIFFGSLLFSASMNLLIVPTGMYNGGFLGIAQLIRMFAGDKLQFLSFGGDLAGTLYFLLNIPLLLLAFHQFGRLFFGKTVFCVVCYSVLLSAVPIPSAPLLDETIALCLIGGLACGAGAAITLIAGCSGGGEEIMGLVLSRRFSSFSVGKFSILLNVLVYGIGFFCFDFQIVVYSIIFSSITYITLDRVHLQNIMMTLFIITKEPGMEQAVFDCVHRGATVWEGKGGYSGDTSQILMTVVSKKEALELRETLKEKDPNVFIICSEDVSVTGNFQKRI